MHLLFQNHIHLQIYISIFICINAILYTNSIAKLSDVQKRIKKMTHHFSPFPLEDSCFDRLVIAISCFSKEKRRRLVFKTLKTAC